MKTIIYNKKQETIKRKHKIYKEKTAANNKGCLTANNTHISIKLPDKTREIVVLEIARQNQPGKLQRVPHHEALSGRTPRDDGIKRRVVHEIKSLGQKRRNWVPVQTIQGLRDISSWSRCKRRECFQLLHSGGKSNGFHRQRRRLRHGRGNNSSIWRGFRVVLFLFVH